MGTQIGGGLYLHEQLYWDATEVVKGKTPLQIKQDAINKNVAKIKILQELKNNGLVKVLSEMRKLHIGDRFSEDVAEKHIKLANQLDLLEQ